MSDNKTLFAAQEFVDWHAGSLAFDVPQSQIYGGLGLIDHAGATDGLQAFIQFGEDGIADYEPMISHEGVSVTRVERGDSENYLFIYVAIDPDAETGTFVDENRVTRPTQVRPTSKVRLGSAVELRMRAASTGDSRVAAPALLR